MSTVRSSATCCRCTPPPPGGGGGVPPRHFPGGAPPGTPPGGRPAPGAPARPPPRPPGGAGPPGGGGPPPPRAGGGGVPRPNCRRRCHPGNAPVGGPRPGGPGVRLDRHCRPGRDARRDALGGGGLGGGAAAPVVNRPRLPDLVGQARERAHPRALFAPPVHSPHRVEGARYSELDMGEGGGDSAAAPYVLLTREPTVA